MLRQKQLTACNTNFSLIYLLRSFYNKYMIDINKQIAHWRDGSLEEWQVAQDILEKKHVRQALFWAHLTLEKILKAHVCKHTGDIPPKIHNLARLGKLSGLDISSDVENFLSDMNKYCLAGRYLEHQGPVPNIAEAKSIMQEVEENLQWLIKAL